MAYTSIYSSWLNRIEGQSQALRYYTLYDTDHASHREQASMICCYIIWRDRNAHDRALRELIKRANVACHGSSANERGSNDENPAAAQLVADPTLSIVPMSTPNAFAGRGRTDSLLDERGEAMLGTTHHCASGRPDVSSHPASAVRLDRYCTPGYGRGCPRPASWMSQRR